MPRLVGIFAISPVEHPGAFAMIINQTAPIDSVVVLSPQGVRAQHWLVEELDNGNYSIISEKDKSPAFASNSVGGQWVMAGHFSPPPETRKEWIISPPPTLVGGRYSIQSAESSTFWSVDSGLPDSIVHLKKMMPGLPHIWEFRGPLPQE